MYRLSRWISPVAVLAGFCCLLGSMTRSNAAAPAPGLIGVARLDITPAYPVRLTGYAARTNLSAGTAQRLWAKALALGDDREGARILITVDNCGVPANVVEEVAGRMALKRRIRRSDFVVASSHTHSGPMVRGFAENIFIRDLTAEEAAASDQYTRELTDMLESVANAALADRKPGRLFRAEGKVGFAANRRTAGGPVDHSLPVLVVRDLDGGLRAVVANYACHCTTLGSEVNRYHGDWAGFAQEFIEADHPGAIAMITIGCGADANPTPRGGADFGVGFARKYGRALATELNWVTGGALEPLPAVPTTSHQRLMLPFQELPTREGWERRAKESGIVGYHARKNLARLDRGETLPTELPYFVQTWAFEDRLAMVFLAGEVVVDYNLKLKREFDASRLWVSGYANDVPCYIPSRRILAEGGYEAEQSLWYYDRPARLSGEIEDLIHTAVTNRLPAAFRADPRSAEFPPAKSPEESLKALFVHPGLRVELVASEPLVQSPVAIDFGADGRLWVCEMRDYPSGLDGKGQPGGRVKVLEDRDGDGVFDTAKLVAEGFPYPTGIMAWKGGALIGAAPDVVFVPEEAATIQGPSDPRARRLLTGFATHNFQARVNGFRWGLDGWVYASGGLFGGKVASTLSGRAVEASGRDFRWHPDTGEFEALAGVSQQDRVRDDFGEWFGNDNSTLLWHFPLADRYSRRNPHIAPPEPRVMMNRDDNRVFPRSRTLERFNDPQAANQLTSVCSPEIYRDDLLGAEFAGNAFTCEPVHNLVRRALIEPAGASFAARRAPEEQDREFLASRDNWFRPVEVRTGPDGALWVVDMYRFVIEHPRWIPAERLAQLDVRAGADRGRIYRILPEGRPARPIRNLARLDPAAWVASMISPNGVERDLAQRLLMGRGGVLARPDRARLETLVRRPGRRPALKVQAAYTLAGLGGLSDATLKDGLKSTDPRVVRALLPLAEGRRGLSPFVARLVPDGSAVSTLDPGVAFQLCLSLGKAGDAESALALKRLAPWRKDPLLRAAWLSSATSDLTARQMLEVVGSVEEPGLGDVEAARALVRTLAGRGADAALGAVLVPWMSPGSGDRGGGMAVLLRRSWAWLPLEEELLAHEGLQRALGASKSVEVRAALRRLEEQATPAALAALDRGDLESLAPASVSAAIGVLGEMAARDGEAQARLIALLDGPLMASQRGVLVAAMARCGEAGFARLALRGWAKHGPSARSAMIGVLLGREAQLMELAGAIDRGEVRIQELDPNQRARLLEHSPEAVRQKLSALAVPSLEGRGEVVKSFASVDGMRGDVARGAVQFEKLCTPCHRVKDKGNILGPDLAPFAAKPVADFLVAILDPSAAIDPRYLAYEVVLRDGREISGVVRSETGTSVVLGQAGGVSETLLRSDIVSMRALTKSLMPEGLEQGLVPQDIADLIAWLKQ